MTYAQSILLGVLQGVTEFLPVSSSGHLAILEHYFGVQHVPLLFDVLLHAATLIVVVIVFRTKIWELLKGVYHITRGVPFPESEQTKRFLIALILSTLCTGIVGLPLKKYLEDQVSLSLIALFFLVTATFLLISQIVKEGNRTASHLTLWDGILIGIAQGIGVLPGISRSGITISTALLIGFTRGFSGEYSFILSIPAILGALALTLKDVATLKEQVAWGVLLAGVFAAFVAGLGALKLLLATVKGGRLHWYAFYLLPLGVLGLLFL